MLITSIYKKYRTMFSSPSKSPASIIFFILLSILFSNPSSVAQETTRDCIPLNVTGPSRLIVNDTNTRSGTSIRASCVEPYFINGDTGKEYSEYVCIDGVWKPSLPRCSAPSMSGGQSNDRLKWALVGAILGGACCLAVVSLIVYLHFKAKRVKELIDTESKCDLDLYNDDDVHSFTKSNELRGIPDYFAQERRSSLTEPHPDGCH